MRQPWTRLAALAAALALTASCTGKPADTYTAPVPPPQAESPTPTTQDGLVALKRESLPKALQDWASARETELDPSYQVIEIGGETYIGVSAGRKPNGGFDLGLRRSWVQQEGSSEMLYLHIAIVPPHPLESVMDAAQTPQAFFKYGGKHVTVKLIDETHWAEQVELGLPFTLALKWEAGTHAYLEAHGTAPAPEVVIEILNGDKVLQSTKANVQNGHFSAALGDQVQPYQTVKVWIPQSDEPALTVAIPERAVGPYSSRHFGYVDARQVGDPNYHAVLIQGESLTDQTFTIEIRVNGQAAARSKPITSKGTIHETIIVPHPLPKDGVEAWFYMNDRLVMVHPSVYWGK